MAAGLHCYKFHDHTSINKQTYIAPDVGRSIISAGQEAYESGGIHHVASSDNEVVKVWTCQSNNSVGIVKVD